MSHKYREPVYPEGFSGVFDTHAHLYDDRFEEMLGEDAPRIILERAVSCGVDMILIPADNVRTSDLAVSYVKKWNGFSGVELFCSVGVHPHEASSYDDEARDYILNTVGKREENRICAIGEIGLDYFYDHSPREIQREVFYEQAKLCFELDIPFILHEREAAGDTIEILNRLKGEGKLLPCPGVCHCCSCSAEVASELIKLGFYIGFDGPLTFRNNRKTPHVLEICPLDRIVVETDSPYLTPEPNRGMMNEPAFVPFVLEKVAEIKNLPISDAASITREKGKRLYRI